jgi:hypothetical protein
LVTDLAGEQRFASIVAKRLETMGALIYGDRKATDQVGLAQFLIDTNYGRLALEGVMKAVMGHGSPTIPPPIEYPGEFFKGLSNFLSNCVFIFGSLLMFYFYIIFFLFLRL